LYQQRDNCNDGEFLQECPSLAIFTDSFVLDHLYQIHNEKLFIIHTRDEASARP